MVELADLNVDYVSKSGQLVLNTHDWWGVTFENGIGNRSPIDYLGFLRYLTMVQYWLVLSKYLVWVFEEVVNVLCL